MWRLLRQASSRHITEPRASAVGAAACFSMLPCRAFSSDALSESS